MKLLFKTILALMLILSQEACSQKADDEARFKKFWQEFARVVQAGDTAAFKKMSLERITCFGCLSNTDEESAKFRLIEPNKFTEEQWFEVVSIDINKFLKEDFNLQFDSILVFNMAYENQYYVSLTEREFDAFFKNKSYFTPIVKEKQFTSYSAFVTKYTENKLHPGLQIIFDFIETKDGFKLYGIWTIP